MQSDDARLVRREEKEENIQRLVGHFLDRLSNKESAPSADRRITLVARSPLSPAAKALLSHAQQMRRLNVQVDVVFARTEPADAYSQWVELAVSDHSLSDRSVNMRWLKREQLLEAHEQISLGSACAWWGDCMRREPENRDSFEVTSRFDSEAASRSVRAFEALWAVSAAAPLGQRRLGSSEGRCESEVAGPLDMSGVSAGELPVQGTATIATRH